ncbi:hypothetical protein [Pseudohaliea sp.]|uniref:hypothetical protein n=1 Tax=Pseudohaliea sp. TaxID=2740289 RepID=UPI0032ECAFD8
MKQGRKLASPIGAAIIGFIGTATTLPASADYIFSGFGTSGTFVGEAAEPWILNNVGPFDNWGSPGVGASVTPYLQPDSAFGMDLVFSGVGPIDPASIAIGNGAGCAGGSAGGTTFCNEPFGPDGFWEAFLTGPDAISFRAQSESQVLDQGEDFFVNVFFTGSTQPTDFSFTGRWLTEFSPDPSPVPAPGILSLFAGGLGLIGLLAAGRRRQHPATKA